MNHRLNEKCKPVISLVETFRSAKLQILNKTQNISRCRFDYCSLMPFVCSKLFMVAIDSTSLVSTFFVAGCWQHIYVFFGRASLDSRLFYVVTVAVIFIVTCPAYSSQSFSESTNTLLVDSWLQRLHLSSLKRYLRLY